MDEDWSWRSHEFSGTGARKSVLAECIFHTKTCKGKWCFPKELFGFLLTESFIDQSDRTAPWAYSSGSVPIGTGGGEGGRRSTPDSPRRGDGPTPSTRFRRVSA